MRILYIISFVLLTISSCKVKSKTEKALSKKPIQEENPSEHSNKIIDYYSELSNRETKSLNKTCKVQCVKNTNYNKVPALIGLHPISSFYMDLFTAKELARITANLYKKNDIDSIYYFKYGVLTGITRYNEQLNWHEISRDSIIAKAKLISNGNLKFWWYGFYDEKQKKRVHLKSDFNTLGCENPVLLKKCLED